MSTSSVKIMLLVTGLFVGGFLSGHLWRYLGDNDAIINRYLEVHNTRFISEDSSNEVYFVFYNDIETLNEFANADDQILEVKPASMRNLATVTISNSSLPEALDRLRDQSFIRFVFPGTFPFICH